MRWSSKRWYVRERFVESTAQSQCQASGTAVPCFTTVELEEWNRTGQDAEHEILIKQVAAISYGGELHHGTCNCVLSTEHAYICTQREPSR